MTTLSKLWEVIMYRASGAAIRETRRFESSPPEELTISAPPSTAPADFEVDEFGDVSSPVVRLTFRRVALSSLERRAIYEEVGRGTLPED